MFFRGRNMFFIIFFVLSGVWCEDNFVGYNLSVGVAIDLFANYGDLSQVTQVVSTDYEVEDEMVSPTVPFREQNIKVFSNLTSRELNGNMMDQNMNLMFCDTLEQLLDSYFKDFYIEGSTKPWKAFMGDWLPNEIMHTFGIPYDIQTDNCCYVLLKLTKVHKSVEMDPITNATKLEEYIQQAIDSLNPHNEANFRTFMRNYGTHYIESFVTGNFLYQVFKYKRNGYSQLKAYTRRQNKSTDDLRFYFSSFFLKHVGDIKTASSNKTIEEWAKENLKDSQYLYSRPSLFKLYYNPTLVNKLSDKLDNKALLGIKLKTLKPIFSNIFMGQVFSEVVQNDLQLWENNV